MVLISGKQPYVDLCFTWYFALETGCSESMKVSQESTLQESHCKKAKVHWHFLLYF